jgi:assimilatory nitrate reductase catalytic subunit
MITGQGNGQGGREHGQRCNQLPGARDIENPEHRQFIADFWRIAESELPGKGLSSCEIFDAIEAGKIRGLLTISFNPLVSIPDANRTRAALEKLEFLGCIDFFLSETGRHADVVLAGSLQEEDEGTITTGEGRCVKLQQSVTPPGDARVDWQILTDLAERLGSKDYFPYAISNDIFRELAAASKGGSADYSGMTYAKIEKTMGVFWPCPSFTHPGTPRLFEGGQFHHADGKARFHGYDYRPPAEDVDADYPLFLTTGRVVSQYLSGNQTRRIGPLVDQYPEPLCELHPLLAARLGIADGEIIRIETRRGSIEVPAQIVRTIRPDTVFVPYHWPGRKSANLLTNRVLDPVSKIPEYKVCACRIERLT